jgi:hypothetical protein
MGAPVQEFDDGKPSKSDPPKNAPTKNTPKDVGTAPSGRAMEAPPAPWKRKSRHKVFEGDVAVVELRSRLGLAAEQIPEPEVLFSPGSTFSGVLRLTTGVAMAATVVGLAGYLWGFKLSTKIPELTPPSGQVNVLSAPSTRVASLATSNRDFDQPAVRTARFDLPPVGARDEASPVTSIDSTQRPALLPTPPQTVSPPSLPGRL